VLTLYTEVFLPFDLEFTYGAALHLIMASTLFHSVANDQDFAAKAHEILDELIYKGNRVAQARKTELLNLQNLCLELNRQSEQHGLQPLALGISFNNDVISSTTELPEQMPGTWGGPTGMSVAALMDTSRVDIAQSDAFVPSNLDFLDGIGISSGDFYSIVEEMGSQNIFGSLACEIDPYPFREFDGQA
jgi:proline utilization trans-activator